MQEEDIRQRLTDALEGCDISIDINGSHVAVTIIGDIFEGLRPVKRQQLVYAALNDAITRGDIHAVNITAQTRAEHDA